MRKYEIMIIFDLDGGSIDDHKKFVSDNFSSNKFSLIDEKDMGQRELAYPINEKKRGHYYLYHVDCDPKNFLALEKAFKLYKGIMRFLIIRQS